VFSQPVSDFTSADVTLSGTAGATTATVSGSGSTYTVAVSGMTRTGTVVASVAAGVAQDSNGTANLASTSSANSATYVLLSANERFVSQIYLDVLGRAVDPMGLAFWSGRLAQSESRLQVVQEIESSGEYYSHVVQDCYKRFLHRDADPTGLSAFANFL